MKLQQLVYKCRELEYPPGDLVTDWDYIRRSVYISLHNDIHIKTFFILTKMFYPLKIIGKMLLKDYELYCSSHN